MKIKFDLSTQEGVLAALVAVRNSTLDADKKNELRDILFRYTKSDNDSNLREKLEAILNTIPLPKDYSGRLKGPKKQTEAIENAGFAKKRSAPKFFRTNEYVVDSGISKVEPVSTNTLVNNADVQAKDSQEKLESVLDSDTKSESVETDDIAQVQNMVEASSAVEKTVSSTTSDDSKDVSEVEISKDGAVKNESLQDDDSVEKNKPQVLPTTPKKIYKSPEPGKTLIDQVLNASAVPEQTDVVTEVSHDNSGAQTSPELQKQEVDVEIDNKTSASVNTTPSVSVENKTDNALNQQVASANPSPIATGRNDLARVREIKQWVNDAVGNPVNIVSKDEHAGRRYMTALLAAMQSINSETQAAGTTEMADLEAAFEEVKKVITAEPVKPAGTTSDAKSANDIAQPKVGDNNPLPQQPGQDMVSQFNVGKTETSIPSSLYTTQNDITQQTQTITNETQTLNESAAPMAGQTPVSQPLVNNTFSNNNTPHEGPALRQFNNNQPTQSQSTLGGPASQIPTSKPIPDLANLGIKETPHFSPDQSHNKDLKPNGGTDFSVNGFPVGEPEGVVISDKKLPDQVTQTQNPPVSGQADIAVAPEKNEQLQQSTVSLAPNAFSVQNQTVPTPQSAGISQQKPPLQNTPTPSIPTPQQSNFSVAATKSPTLSQQVQNMEDEALKKNVNLKDPLYSPEIDNGLNQLLLEWSLFKSSGLFGTGPNGREHPLFKQLSPLMVSDILASKFDGARPEIIQSITDYMNGWRYEQGIVYKQGESFEQYLRRVIRFIIDNKK